MNNVYNNTATEVVIKRYKNESVQMDTKNVHILYYTT